MRSSLLPLILLCVLAEAPVWAQELGARSYGLRGGIAANPDQFELGAHVDLGRFTERIRLQPSFELGFGNGVLLGATNFDAHFLFAHRSVRPYAGGGVGLNVVQVRNGLGQGSGIDLRPAINLVGGFEWGASPRALGRYLAEARLGLGDTPELKLVFGINF